MVRNVRPATYEPKRSRGELAFTAVSPNRGMVQPV